MAAIPLYDASTLLVNATTLAGILATGYSPGARRAVLSHSGRQTPTLAGITQYDPRMSVSCVAIKSALDLFGVQGANIIPWLSLSALQWTARKLKIDGPDPEAGSVHERGAATAGTLVFAGLEAPAGGDATISLMAHLISANGTTDPVTWTQQAAPADPATAAPYILDSVSLDGLSLDSVTGVSVSAGSSIERGHGMMPFPRMARIGNVDWSMVIKHQDASLFRAKPDRDAAGSIVLKDRLNGGGNARGTSTVSFSVTGLVEHGDGELRHGDRAGYTTTITGRSVGGNASASWATT